jgi:sugar lactone lactonase YvrE
MFVSEAVSGQLWRIAYDAQNNNYTSNIHISKGFKQFGGLSVSPDGKTLYAGSIFQDKTYGIISTSTKPSLIGQQSYEVIANDMEHLCNGMMLVPGDNALYGTSETGSLTRVDLSTGKHAQVTTDLIKPDGLWYDEKTNLLFIGELLTKKMRVFDVKTQSLLPDYFAAASSAGTIYSYD